MKLFGKKDNRIFKNSQNDEVVCPAMSDVISVANENGIFLAKDVIRKGNKRGLEFMNRGNSRFETSIYIVKNILPIANCGKKLLSTGLLARRVAYVGLGDPFMEHEYY